MDHEFSSVRRRPRAGDRVSSYPHLAAVLPAALTPGLGVVGAGAAWLFGRHFGPGVDAHGRAAIDFQLTLILAAMVAWAGLIGAAGLPHAAAVPLLLTAYFLSVVTPIFAAAATSRGEDYRYPLSLRLFARSRG